MGCAANLPLWREMLDLSLIDGPRGVMFAIGTALTISAALAVLLGLLAWRWTLKPAITLLLFAAAFGAYFMLTYHVVIDPTMMTNVLQTDVHEAADLLSLRLVATLMLLAVVPAVLVWRQPVQYRRWPRRALFNAMTVAGALAVLVGSLLANYQPMASAMRNHHDLRYLANPLNSLYALGRLAAGPLQAKALPLRTIGEDARLAAAAVPPGKPPLLVLVLGETARSGNFGLNGYARDTTPELAKLNVSSLRNVWSCGTSTAASVPCMFSHLGRQEFIKEDRNDETLLDVLQRAGLAVLWIDNQAGCKGVCARVPSISTASFADPSQCAGGECFDGVMLDKLDEHIAALPAERRARGVVLVMHQMGGHGPAYFKRSPPDFKRFMPECQSNVLPDCSRDQLVNAYDNTIAYTDHFLASTIHWLQQREAMWSGAMLYLADHGESLGENNLYLHGIPYAVAPDVQKHVPWISWMSPQFAQQRGLNAACLAQKRDVPLSHDNYFHSVLGLMNVATSVYRPDLDAYAGCSKAGAQQMDPESVVAAKPSLRKPGG
jgi:lipid A ethanolaminephosphotransferase